MPAVVFFGYRVSSPDEPDRKAKAKSVEPVPYLTMLDEVFIIDQGNNKIAKYVRGGDADAGVKSPVSVRVRNYLVKSYPGAWDEKVTDPERKILVVGFRPKLLFQLMAIEASMPVNAKPLPLSAWLWHQRFLDIGDAIRPKEFEDQISIGDAVKRRRCTDAAEAAKWDEAMKDWEQPGLNPQVDAWVASVLATQLGILIGG